MSDRIIIERAYRWHPTDRAEVSPYDLPVSETQEFVIDTIADPDEAFAFDEIELLLLPYRKSYRLLIRDYQDPGKSIIEGDEIKDTFFDLIRYQIDEDEPGSGGLVWPVQQIALLEQHLARSIAPVLVLIRGEQPGTYKLIAPACTRTFSCKDRCCPPRNKPDARRCRICNCKCP